MVANFIYEVGNLKRVKRSGWWLIGISNPESVAEHSFRCIVIGYILAKLEKADLEKVLTMCMLQDLCEARLNDLHKVGQRYINFSKHEIEAFEDSIKALPEEIREEFSELFREYKEQKNLEAIIARDADLLENAFQAMEYREAGYKDAQDWIENIAKLLKTDSAKKIFKDMLKTSPNEWWKGLKKVGRI